MRPLRVLLVDDSESFLKSASDFLSCDPRLRIVGSAMNGRYGVAMAESLAPDLVLMDLNMPELDGLAATERMRSLPAPPRVFLITLLDSSAYRDRAASVGALALISKANFAEEVHGALDALFSGRGSLLSGPPPMPDDQSERETDPASGRSVTGDAETILVVENDEVLRVLAARVLRSAGYNVVAVRDGMDALLAAKDSDDSPAVLVADVVLPGIGPLALADRIQAICPGIKVVLTCGIGDTPAEEDVRTYTGRCLTKPYTPSQLLAVVKEVLASRKA